jgi:hypothetical protein
VKKLWVIVLLLVFLMTIGFLPTKAVSEISIDLWIGKLTARINGQSQSLDAAPYIKNNRTMVPIRFISEQMGAKVDWINSERKVAITMGSVAISLWVDKSVAYVNGVERKLDASPEIVGSRTFVPIRFISENMGAKVYWVDSEQRVTVVQKVIMATSTPTASTATPTPPKPWEVGGEKINEKYYTSDSNTGNKLSIIVDKVLYYPVDLGDYFYTYGLEFRISIENIGSQVDFFYSDNFYLLDPTNMRISSEDVNFVNQDTSATIAPGERAVGYVAFYGGSFMPLPNSEGFKNYTRSTTLPSDTAFAYWRFVFRPSTISEYALKFNFYSSITWQLKDQDKVTP